MSDQRLIDPLYFNCVRKIRELREQHADILANRKAEAEDAQKLVSSAAERKTKMEAGKKDGKNGGGSKGVEGWYAHAVPAYIRTWHITNKWYVPCVGLVIVKALYGHLENLEEEEEDDVDQETEGVIDVTVVLQAMVNESRLTIPSGHSKVTVGI